MSTQQVGTAGVVAGTAGVVAGTGTVGLAQQGRSLQLALRAQMMQDVVRLWPLLDPKRLDETWPGWLQAMIALTNRYHGMSSTAAGIFYQEARQHALDVPAPDALIKLAPLPDESWLSRAYGFSGPGLISDTKAAPTAPLSTTLGTAARIAAEGGRTTVIDTAEADPRAVGFYRVTDGDPCAFCAMLAARGPIYRSAASAGEGNQWHNDCGCTVAPAFSHQHPLDDVAQAAADIYAKSTRGVDGAGKVAAFRKAWNARQH